MKNYKWLTLALASVGLGCCGGSKAAPASEPNAQVSETQKLRDAQVDVATFMCNQITSCAVEAAEAALTKEQEIDRAMVEERRAGCVGAYTQSAMSPRQIEALSSCNTSNLECSEFGDCVAEALKPPEPKS